MVGRTIISKLDRVYRWKWGYGAVSCVLFGITFLLGLSDRTTSLADDIFSGILYGPILAGFIFLVRRYGFQKVAEKSVEIVLSVVLKAGGYAVVPVLYTFNILIGIPYEYLTETVANLLPKILVPLHRLILSIFSAFFVHAVFFTVLQTESRPGDIQSVDFGGGMVRYSASGAFYVVFILVFSIFRFIASYTEMLLSWLSRFRWRFRVVVYG